MVDIEKKSTALGAVATAVVWILMTVLCFALRIAPPHPDYKVIKIQLDAPSAVKKAPALPVQQEASALPQETAPVQKEQPAQKQQPAVKQKTVAKQAAVQPAIEQSKPAQQTLTKSVDELIAENNSAPKKKAVWDDSLFNDADDTKTSTTTTNAASPSVKSESSFSGTAAKGSSSENVSSSASSASSKKQSGTEASSATTAALGKISSATYTQSSGSGVTSSVSASTGSKNGRVTLQMADGNVRELLSPAKPVITISEENAKKISANATVTIRFKVLAGGTVPLSSIEIRPSSLLVLEIQNEIKSQISTWRFAADASGADGQAAFEYSIIKE